MRSRGRAKSTLSWCRYQGVLGFGGVLGVPGGRERTPNLPLQVHGGLRALLSGHVLDEFLMQGRISESSISLHTLLALTYFYCFPGFPSHLQLKAGMGLVLPWNSSNSHPNYSRAGLLMQRGSAGCSSIIWSIISIPTEFRI